MIKRLIWYWNSDRLGPDMLTTHPLLFFKKTNKWLCKKKFKVFGEGSEFRPYAYAICTFNISIGKNVVIRPNTMLFADETPDGQIIIEDDVMFGPGVHIYVNNHKFDDVGMPIIDQGYYPSQNVILRKGCWVGANSILLPGIEIGVNAVVGAGSVVTKSIPPKVVAVGNPAKVIKHLK